jgi:hypothetical protein
VTPEQRAGIEARHRLYARDEAIARGWDDPAWCLCGQPWDLCEQANLLDALAKAEQREAALADAVRGYIDSEVTVPDWLTEMAHKAYLDSRAARGSRP